MNNLLKKAGMALIMTLIITSPVSAEPNENNTNDPIQNIQINIEKFDKQIETVMSKINDNNKQILETENTIKVTEGELKVAESNLNEQKNLVSNRVRAMYINGFEGYLNALLSSKDISELLSNSDTVKRVMNLDENIVNKYESKKDTVKSKKETLESKNKALLALKTDNEKELSGLNKDKEEQQKLLAKVREALKLNPSDYEQTSIVDAMKYLESIKDKASVEAFSKGNTAATSDNIIAFAASFIGTQYVWGGTSPKPGFDCSGFTQYVYAKYGVSIGRTTYDQIKDGVLVTRDKLKPGDLILFGSWLDPHHVGIYIGFGAYIHAPHTGDVIKVSPLNRSDYLTARRVM